MKIHNTANVGTNGVKGLIYGPSGVGKTTLAATAESPFVISAESGLLSLRKFVIAYAPVTTMEEVFDIYKWLLSSNEAKQFNDIFMDSLSEIMEVLLSKEKKENKDPRKAYGQLADRGVEFARAFRDLPGKNVWILCKEEFSKDEITGVTNYGPAMPGSKLGPSLPYYFDEVFRYERGIDSTATPPTHWRALRTQTSFNSTAKDRSGMLSEWEQPNIKAITDKILGRG